MDQIVIRNRIQRDYGMVPNAIWDLEVSIKAKAICAWLCSLRDGAAVSAAMIEDKLRIGPDARRAAMAQLEALGIVEWKPITGLGGRVMGRRLEFDIDAILHASDRGGDFPDVGKNRRAGGENPAPAPEKPAQIIIDKDTLSLGSAGSEPVDNSAVDADARELARRVRSDRDLAQAVRHMLEPLPRAEFVQVSRYARKKSGFGVAAFKRLLEHVRLGMRQGMDFHDAITSAVSSEGIEV